MKKKKFDANSRNYLTDYKIIGNKIYLYLSTGEIMHTVYSEAIAKKIKKKVENQVNDYKAEKEALQNRCFWAEMKRMITIPIAYLLLIGTSVLVTTNIVVLSVMGVILVFGSLKLFKTFDKEVMTARSDSGKFINSPEVLALLTLKEKVKSISSEKQVGCKPERSMGKGQSLMTLEDLKKLKAQALEEKSAKPKVEKTGTVIKLRPNGRH